MCGRFYIDESAELQACVTEMNRSPLLSRFPRTDTVVRLGEAAPACVVPVVASDRSGQRAVFPMKWGFTIRRSNGSTALLINARLETAASKPVFREPWAAHRCAVPAAWYFEWGPPAAAADEQARKQKYRIRPAGVHVTWLCGLYRLEHGLPVFTILTREPGKAIRFIHDRMPLILPGDCVPGWIDPHGRPGELADMAQTEMVFEDVPG